MANHIYRMEGSIERFIIKNLTRNRQSAVLVRVNYVLYLGGIRHHSRLALSLHRVHL